MVRYIYPVYSRDQWTTNRHDKEQHHDGMLLDTAFILLHCELCQNNIVFAKVKHVEEESKGKRTYCICLSSLIRIEYKPTSTSACLIFE